MKLDKSNINQFIQGTMLFFYNKGVTSIESIPDHITDIYCYNNKLTYLPKLPDSLKELHCEDNQLTSLPKLPSSLVYLSCWNNKLTSVPINATDKQWMENHNKLLNRSIIINKIYENR